MKVTAKQIAEQAGVSQATVSLVLHGKPGVSEAVRRRVLALAREAGYQPDPGRALAAGRILQLVIYKRHGRVVADEAFFDDLIEGVMQQATALGYHLSVSYFYGGQPEKEQIRSIKSLRCAGLILLATEMHTADLRPFRELRCPIVILDNFFPTVDCDSVTINNLTGAWRAVKYLIDCGHVRIGYLHSKVEIRNFAERSNGYLSGCRLLPEEAARDAAHRVIRVGPSGEEAAADLEAYLAREPLLPTAFFADNDRIAAGCCKALQKSGVLIPQEVSVIGFDGSSLGELLTPSLTTMQVHKHRMGALAVERLHARLCGDPPETLRIALTPELVVRQSVRGRAR